MEDRIIDSINRYVPNLADMTLEARPEADRGSIEVAAAVEMLIVTIHIINRIDNSAKARAIIDALVDKLPRSMEDRRVSLLAAIPDKEFQDQASQVIMGAYNTNLKGAFTAIYNTRVAHDLSEMSRLENGPFGEIGGWSAVIGRALVGKDKTPNMVHLMDIIGKHFENIAAAFKSSKAGSSACFVATACCGTPNSETVLTLRLFREDYLKKHEIGRLFVKKYYQFSPRIADYIRHHKYARRISYIFVASISKLINLTAYRKRNI